MELETAYEQVCDGIIELMNSKPCTVMAFFRRCDVNENQRISLPEFSQGLSKHLSIKFDNNEMIEQLFEKFTDNREVMLVDDLYDHLYKDDVLNSQDLYDIKLSFMNGKDMIIEKNIKDVFNYIHRGKEITFPSLVKFAREINKRMPILHLDQLFRHFDRE